MNYEPNDTDWKIGDLVIHDCDAKRPDMLAKVVEKNETKQGMRYRIEYFDKAKNYEQWWNSIKVLHDPKRFDIDTTSIYNTNQEESFKEEP